MNKWTGKKNPAQQISF